MLLKWSLGIADRADEKEIRGGGDRLFPLPSLISTRPTRKRRLEGNECVWEVPPFSYPTKEPKIPSIQLGHLAVSVCLWEHGTLICM